jgi:hypothetical protein
VVDRARAQAARRLTVVEVVTAEGPLEEARLGWVADLYGEVDPKYRDLTYIENLFSRGPAGPALHAFATDDRVPVGHAAVVPTPARRGRGTLRAGKLEALVVEASHRGSRGEGPPVVRLMLDALYALADARGFEVIHAYVLPRVGRTIRFTRLDGVAAPSLVSLLKPTRTGAKGRAEWLLATAQRSARAIAGLGGARASARIVRPVAAGDSGLLKTPSLQAEAWAIVADGALDWYASSPYLRILEPGDGARALVQLPGSPRDALRVAAWESPSPGIGSALVLLDAAARLGRESDAATLRLQFAPLDPSLRRAARALGFVERNDLSTLWVRTADPDLARPDAVRATPSLYLGF